MFRRLGELGVPSFAYYNGAAMGGGVEIGLHCTYRTIVRRPGVRAARGVPRPGARLGRDVPAAEPDRRGEGAQGRHRQPLAQNRTLKGGQAHELGIADAIFDSADFLEESLAWTARVLNGDITVTRPEVDKGKAWDDAVAMARWNLDGKLHGAAPSFTRALDLVAAAKDRSRDEGFAAEDEALADLIMSDELRAYSTHSTSPRSARRSPPRPTSRSPARSPRSASSARA